MNALIFTLRLVVAFIVALPVYGDPVFEKLFNFNDARSDIDLDARILGKYPQSALVLGRDRDFYGTTMLGGEADCGTIFRLTANGKLAWPASSSII